MPETSTPPDPANDTAADAGNRNRRRTKSLAEAMERALAAPALSESEVAAENSRRQLEHRAKKIRRLVAQAGEAYGGCTFDSWEADSPRKRVVKSGVQSWAESWRARFELGEGLVLFGPVGTGKDHLAISACREIIERHASTVWWVNGRDFCGDARDAMFDRTRSDSDLMRLCGWIDLLVVSDPLPAIGQLTMQQADWLYRIAHLRDDAGKPTVWTLNVADDNEADTRLGAATWDRACHRAWKIRCNWPSYRKPERIV